MIVHRKLLLSLIGLSALFLVHAGSAVAIPGPWVKPAKSIDRNAHVGFSQAKVAVAADGTAVAVWMVTHPGPESETTNSVLASLRPKGRTFGKPFALTGRDDRLFDLHLVAGRGGIVVTWLREEGGKNILQARSRPLRGGKFSPERTIGTSPYGVYETDLAMGGNGLTIAAWRTPRATPSTVIRASIKPRSGKFGPAFDISQDLPNADTGAPAADVAKNGTITVAWSENTNDGILAARRAPGGSFGEPVVVTPERAGDPKIASGPGGTVTLVWQRYGEKSTGYYTASKKVGGRWGQPVFLAKPSWDATGQAMDLAVAKGGLVTLIWDEYRRAGGICDDNECQPAYNQTYTRMATWKPGQQPKKQRIGLTNTSGSQPAVVASPDGSTTLIWQSQWSWQKVHGILTMTRRPDGTYTKPISLDGEVPAAVVEAAGSRDGSVVAVWPSEAHGVASIRTSSALPSRCRAHPRAAGCPKKKAKLGVRRAS